MKVFAWVGGVVVLAGLVVLAVAGTSGATAILVTGVAQMVRTVPRRPMAEP